VKGEESIGSLLTDGCLRIGHEPTVPMQDGPGPIGLRRGTREPPPAPVPGRGDRHR
jgi:hypothetical protein